MITRAEHVRRAKEEGLDPLWAGKIWDLMKIHVPEKVLPEDWVEACTVVEITFVRSGYKWQELVPEDMPKEQLTQFFTKHYGHPVTAVVI
jgi:hypothetical protein